MAGGAPCELPLQLQVGRLSNSVVDAIEGCGISALEEVDNEFVCVICTQPCFGGVQTSCCEHLLHSRCLQQWLAVRRTCPHCRKSLAGVSEPSRSLGRVLQSLINTKRVACPQGCGAEFQWEGLEAHVRSSCTATPMVCPHEGCAQEAPRNRIQQHMAECEHGRVVCECSRELKRRDLEEHRRQSCPKVPVACEHCGERVERGALSSHRREDCSAPVQMRQLTALEERVETLEQQLQESLQREAAATDREAAAIERGTEAIEREAAARALAETAQAQNAQLLELLQGKAESESLELLQRRVESLERLQREASSASSTQPASGQTAQAAQAAQASAGTPSTPSLSASRSVSRLRAQVAASQGSKHWTASLVFRTKEWEARKWAAKHGADFDEGVRVSLCYASEQSGDVHYEVIMTTRPLGLTYKYDEAKQRWKIKRVVVGGQAEYLGIPPGHFVLACNDVGLSADPKSPATDQIQRELQHLPKILPEEERLFLVKGVDKGRDAWYYVFVKNESLDEFKRELDSPMIHLEEHGEVFVSGYGNEPPQSARDKVARRIGLPLDSEDPVQSVSIGK